MADLLAACWIAIRKRNQTEKTYPSNYRIRLTSNASPDVFDESDGDFTIDEALESTQGALWAVHFDFGPHAQTGHEQADHP